jgi:hypothetical protein
MRAELEANAPLGERKPKKLLASCRLEQPRFCDLIEMMFIQKQAIAAHCGDELSVRADGEDTWRTI